MQNQQQYQSSSPREQQETSEHTATSTAWGHGASANSELCHEALSQFESSGRLDDGSFPAAAAAPLEG